MSDLFTFETFPSENIENDDIVVGGISAAEYLRKFDKNENDMYNRFDSLTVPVGLQFSSMDYIPEHDATNGLYNGGENELKDVYTMMNENEYERMFRSISNNLGYSKKSNTNKTKKRSRK